MVFVLGKRGGRALNFSSDIDLVYAYAADGQSDGARPLAAEAWFARLGQQLAKLLDEVTADGFCYRVDLRLRPFGNAGRVALSFAAMEQYKSEEHTSELQSLMRISYAVICLKKKKKIYQKFKRAYSYTNQIR